jgi:hypothetical protein
MGWIKQRTTEPQNNEPQNFEGWFRYAQSFNKIFQMMMIATKPGKNTKHSFGFCG